jgi:hypothetical protein
MIDMTHVTITISMQLIVIAIPAKIIAVFFICSPFYGFTAGKAKFCKYFHTEFFMVILK